MRIAEALALSTSPDGMATGKSARGREVVAIRHLKGIRIVRGVTDPTVVRKLTSTEWVSDQWEPVKGETE